MPKEERTGRPNFARTILCASLALAFPWKFSASAGTIGDDFREVLLAARPKSPVVGIAFLSEQLDVQALEDEMDREGLHTRWRRHERVVKEARALADRTQTRLVLDLEARRELGGILRIRPFWIVNAVAVEAPAETFAALALLPDVREIHANLQLPLKIAGTPIDASEEQLNPTNGHSPNHAEDGTPPHLSTLESEVLENRAIEDGLRVIHAPEAWARGYTGRGILIGHFDSGAFHLHEGFANRWRGALQGIPWWQAWHDPYTMSELPYDSNPQGHGTHVLGIMLASRPDLEPLGVAYEANWIAAGALIDYNVEKILGTFEWAIDPDLDPSTIEDVPYALNHSWGTNDDCSDVYWGAIDVLEAAGVANVFAVDNSGPQPRSVNSPESRSISPYRNFSVGGLNPHRKDLLVRSASGRGPSPCDDVSIKPEVVGPGTSIQSTLPARKGGPPEGSYGLLTGNSMAAPHVTGALALLFQANPSLTTDVVKEALMATALDLGIVGEDNDYGFGLIDVNAALTWIETNYPPYPAPFSALGPSVPADVIVLHWNPPRSVVPGRTLVSYRIYRTEGEDPFGDVPLIEVPAFPTSFYDRGLSGEFRYVITAVYNDGFESEPTPEIRATASRSPHERTNPVLEASVAPNPFRESATIHLVIDEPGTFTVAVHDVSGALVRTLHTGRLVAGPHALRWDGSAEDGRRAATGTYFLRVSAPGRARAERLVLLR